MQLIGEVYRLVRLLPKTETYALSDQMRRCAISIASNIAEGQGRDTVREFIYFLTIARGSCFELNTQVEAGVLVGYFTDDDVENSLNLLSEIGRMLNSLIRKLESYN